MQFRPRYQIGDKIGGRYLVHQALMGGMGEVYLCLDLEQNLPYALKTFQSRFLNTPQIRERFEEEVATWIALEKHPNIVRCFFMHLIDNRPFMFLEWIVGDEIHRADLRSWLRHVPLELRLALEFAIDICRGLIHAQQKRPGIVHRDLKPENILIAQGQLAKITDWGLATIVEHLHQEMTDTKGKPGVRQSLVSRAGIAGTPAYMAPEQWEAEALDIRTDIYALGAILYEMLTGHWLYQAETVEMFRHQHLKVPVPKLTRQDSLPGDLNEVVTCCLAKRKADRFATVDDLLQALSQIYQREFAQPPRNIAVRGEFTTVDYNNRGYTYYTLRRYEDALADYNRAIALEPNSAKAYANRGVVYEKMRRYTEALADLTHALELEPTHAQTYNNRAATFDSLGRYEEALRDYTGAIALDPNSAKAYSNRGTTFARLQRYAEALADFTRAIELNPGYALAYANRGKIYADLKRYDNALADYARAIELDPTLAVAYANRGRTYANLQRYDEALADCSRAIELEPTHAQDYIDRGNIHYSLQHYEEALADLTRAIELHPTKAMAYFDRGNTYYRLQRDDEALADYTRAIEIDPTHAQAYLNTGVLLVNCGALQTALSFFEKAAELGHPQGARYVVQVKQALR